MNIHTELIAANIRSRMRRDGHYHDNLITMKDWLDYMLYTFLIRLTIIKTGTESFAVNLESLDPQQPYKQDVAWSDTEKKVWIEGMSYSLAWANSNRPYTYADFVRDDKVYTQLFGFIRVTDLISIKESVSSHSSTIGEIKFLNHSVNIEMAKRLITYCEMVLGISAARLNAPITPTVIPVTAPTEYELVDDTIPATPGIDGQTFTMDLGHTHYNSDGESNVAESGLIWTRQGIEEQYGEDFVHYIEGTIDDGIGDLSNEELNDWLESYRTARSQQTTEADEDQEDDL